MLSKIIKFTTSNPAIQYKEEKSVLVFAAKILMKDLINKLLNGPQNPAIKASKINKNRDRDRDMEINLILLNSR